ncbi:f-box domain-containing protein [Pyrenophora teres f. maculata]|nr:f-box domain-containing protein [Pyrenophora teres f. maculata]
MSAIESFVRRKDSFQAYSRIRSLGHGNTFVYRQGTICVLHGEVVRISDLRSQSSNILDLVSIIRQKYPIVSGECKVQLLNYSEGILAVYCTKIRGSEASYIYAINTAPECPTGKRVIERIPLTACDRLLVRHNSRYLYYVTHTGRGDDGERKWEIDGISLDINFPLPRRERPLLLENFHGSDIGSTIAFEIHNDHFYAVSNQGSSEVEEIDYTSFYHVVRFPLNSPLPDEVEKDERLYRRQHKEGPIHDTWTDLTLQVDDCTNETVIVESRREWAQASSRQSRTFYVTKLNFGENFEDMLDEQLLPENDPLVPLIDSSNHPHWKPTPAIYSWSQHPEFSGTDTTRRSFMLARTKFRAYNYACTSFLDLVEDDRCCSNPSQPPCLRLRVGARREMGLQHTYSNSDSNTKAKAKSPITTHQRPTFVDTSTQYRHSPIRMWPPPASHCPCSKHLHIIMNPALPSGNTPHARSVIGILDGNYFIYMVKPARTYRSGDDSALGSIVVVDFSRGFPVAGGENGQGEKTSASALSSASVYGTCGKYNAPVVSPATVAYSSPATSWIWSPGQERRCREGTC